MYFFADQSDNDAGEYNPKLYISTDWDPPVASMEAEEKMNSFERRLARLNSENRRRIESNLTKISAKYLRK